MSSGPSTAGRARRARPLRWLLDLPIRHKLYLILGLLVLNLAVVIGLNVFGLGVFSSVRALVGGEGLWAKAQKNAIYSLGRYALSHDEADYKAFLDHMAVPLGDRVARRELEKPRPDLDRVAHGFVLGRNHPADARGMAEVFYRFGKVGPVRRAIGIWTQADSRIDVLLGLASQMHEAISSGHATPERLAALTTEIERVNQELTRLEDNFSYTMGEASRWARGLLILLTVTISLLIGTLSVLIALYIGNAVVRGVDGVAHAAARAAEGDLAVRVETDTDDELGVLARAFNDMTQSLAKLDQMKSNFLSTVSHELRTPLTLSLAPLESLLAGDYGAVDGRQREALQVMHNNAVRLLQMVNGLLDFSRLSAGKVEVNRESTAPVALTESILADFRPLARSKQIGVELQADAPGSLVQIDRYLFERILFNLLSNAIKFTPAGGRITVALRHQDDRLRLVVRDTGIGIPDADLRHLFQKFRQLDASSTRRFEGTGLGLALVKEFATLLGGSVTAESEIGRGSVFTVELQAPRAAPAADGAPLQPAGASMLKVQRYDAPSGMEATIATAGLEALPRILIAEDNVELGVYLAGLLRDIGQTRIAHDGVEAAALVREWSPDLVISDVMMPRKDGLTLCREIKGNPHTAPTPVILLTALTDRESMLRGWEAGADEYLFKPFHPREAATRVKAMLASTQQRSRAEREAQESLSLLKATLESTTDGILVVDRNGKIVRFNQRFVEMWRIPETVLRSRDDNRALSFVIDQLKNPNDFLDKVRELYDQPEAESFDVLEFQDGRSFERHSKPHRVEGRPTGRVWSFRDVTDRARAQSALARTARQLSEAQAIAHVARWELDIGKDALAWSDGLSQILGLPPQPWPTPFESLLGRIHPADRARFEAAIQEARQTRQPFELDHCIVRPGGEVRWLNSRGQVYVGPDGQAVRIAGTAQEITERKHAEGRLRRSEELMREAQELARIGSFEWDAITNAVTWSDGLRQVYGVAEGTAPTYEDYLRYVHPTHREQVRAAVQRTFNTGAPFEHDYRIVTADGTEKWVHARGELLMEPRTGKRLGLRGYCQDITEQKRAEAAVALLAAIVESSDDAIVAETLEGSITTWNRGAERLYGYTAAEAIGKPFAMLVPGGRSSEFLALLDRLRRGEPTEQLRAPLLRKGGTPIEVLIRVSAIRDPSGEIVGVSTIARGVAVVGLRPEAADTSASRELLSDEPPETRSA